MDTERLIKDLQGLDVDSRLQGIVDNTIGLVREVERVLGGEDKYREPVIIGSGQSDESN